MMVVLLPELLVVEASVRAAWTLGEAETEEAADTLEGAIVEETVGDAVPGQNVT